MKIGQEWRRLREKRKPQEELALKIRKKVSIIAEKGEEEENVNQNRRLEVKRKEEGGRI